MPRDSMLAPKCCSRDDCDRKVAARGLCHKHYQTWLNKRPAPLGIVNSNDAILAAMPGTAQKIAAACGLSYEGARKAINKLRADSKAHIEDILPPGEESKGRYVRVFTAGPGKDAKITPKERRDNKRASRRAYEQSKKLKPQPIPLLYADVFNLSGRRPCPAVTDYQEQ